MPTPLFIQASLYDGPNVGTILIPYVDALPLEPTSRRALILDQLVGSNVAGLYVYDDTQSWRYALPIEAVSAIVVGGDQCDVYINVSQTYNLGQDTIVYRNGQLQTGHDVTPASAVYAVRTPTTAQGAITDVVSSGIGTSLIKSKAFGVVTLKSLVAGPNITLTDDGAGNLSIASTASGSQSTTLLGDVTGTGTGTIATTLAITGVVAGSYTKVTVDAKGRVTAGSNPTTLAGLGITDALPLTGGSMSGSITMTAGSTITGVPDPVSALDAANKDYVDAQLAAAANGVSWRASAAAATTANLATLSGLQTIDGYVLQAGDRVLVKNQTTTTANGIYDAAGGAWVRSADSDTGGEIYHAAYLVVNGTVNGLTQWANTNQTTPVIGTDPVLFGQLRAQSSVYTAGSGLTLSGLQFSLAPTGVAAGSYTKVTVNALGQVTAGSSLSSADIAASLGYTPYNGTTNPNGFIGALTASGDAAGTTIVTGSSGTLTLTLSNSGVTAGTYTSVVVDAKGRVTAGGQITPSQITSALGYTPVNKAGDTLSGALNLNAISTLASATTTNIGAAASNLLAVSGTTTIANFDSVVGALRTLVFQGSLTLTHNATGIILPGGANIVTAVGDVATFFNVGGSTWRCLAYTRADGTSIKGSNGSPFSTVQIFNGSVTDLAAEFTNAVELARVTVASPSSTTNFDVQLGSIQQYTLNTGANWTLNFRFNSTTTLNSVMLPSMAITAALIVVNGSTAFYPSTIKIDGISVVPKWQGGTAPTAGTPGSYDIYTFTIIKGSGANSYTVFAAQTSYL